MAAILPGATIGIFGGGQLGRMTAMAARSLGYHLAVLDPDPSCAARFVVEHCLTAAFDDVAAAEELAKRSAVTTIEIEKIDRRCLDAAAKYGPVRPSAECLWIIQDRARQKAWLERGGFPLGDYRAATDEKTLADGIDALGGNCFVKACGGGYDGRGQVRTGAASDAAHAWRELGCASCVAERALAIEAELSVLVARRPSGEMAVYPPALNHHEEQILVWSVLPAPLPERVTREAQEIARAITERMQIEGLLVVELFLVGEKLLVNELAPRPHNSFHASEIACATSQFEQDVRAICDLPLGAVDILRPAAIANLLGDLWSDTSAPHFDAALALPGVRLHLYGKRIARPGRKMGHLSATGNSPQEAVARVQEAYARLR